MVYTRKPKLRMPLKYADGGVVPMPDPPPPPEERFASTDDAMRQALEAQQHAEQMARAAAQEPDPLRDYIARLPGLSEFKRDVLMRKPHYLDGSNVEIVRRAHEDALNRGVKDDSPEMEAELDRGFRREMAARVERAMQPTQSSMTAQPTPENLPEPEPDPERHMPRMQAPPPVQHTPARRSIPVSAPVSRDAPGSSGRPQSSSGQITLSPEERDIARRSFTNPNMSDLEKERLYAANKLRYRTMLANGTYSNQTGGG